MGYTEFEYKKTLAILLNYKKIIFCKDNLTEGMYGYNNNNIPECEITTFNGEANTEIHTMDMNFLDVKEGDLNDPHTFFLIRVTLKINGYTILRLNMCDSICHICTEYWPSMELPKNDVTVMDKIFGEEKNHTEENHIQALDYFFKKSNAVMSEDLELENIKNYNKK